MNQSLLSTVKSEFLKFRTVRSTITGLVTFVVLTIGISAIVCLAIKSHWNDPGSHFDHLLFDPTGTSLAGSFLGQFAAGSIGIIAITSEYSTGSIRTTLAATPKRLRVVFAKLLVLFASLLLLGELTVVVAFSVGQSIFKGTVPTASLSSGSVLRAVLLGGLYLTLVTLLGYGIGLIVRTTAFSIILYAVGLLILPIIVNFLPTSLNNAIGKFLPSNLGSSMSATSPQAHMFGAGAASAVLVLYVAIVVVAGALLVTRRDA